MSLIFRNNHLKQTYFGFTLVELMIVIGIIGILATLVFPSFQQQVRESRRKEAATQLLSIKLQQEQYRLRSPTFAKASQLSLPNSPYFDFKIENVSATTYTIIARAKSSQAQDKQCVSISIDQSMQRKPLHCFN